MTQPAAGAPLLLVVDDEPANVDVLCDLLRVLDYRTVGAGSGEAALAMPASGGRTWCCWT